MKIWFDILTPKQVLFFEPMIKKLRKKHSVLCTSRNYREAIQLAKIRNLKVHVIGKHGGAERYSKLNESLKRMVDLSKIVKKYSPDLTISLCSPEASRISYGLGIKHIVFSNAPHAEAVMKLSIPLAQKLLTPWIIPKRKFSKYGISEKDIIHYRALDEYVIVKEKPKRKTLPPLKLKRNKTILFRTHESQASYFLKNRKINIVSMIKKIAKEFPDYNLIVLGRYSKQINELQKNLGKNIAVLNKVVDSGEILSISDVFIGSGGTMTQEAALKGIPTISYSAVPGYQDEEYLVRKGLVRKGKNPETIVKLIKALTKSDKNARKLKAKKILDSMEDPFLKLEIAIKSVTE